MASASFVHWYSVMEINTSAPLSRQLLPKAIAIFVAVALLLCWVSLWFLQTTQSLEAELKDKLPQTQAALLQAQSQTKLLRLANQALSLRLGDQAFQLHNDIIKALNATDIIYNRADLTKVSEFNISVVERLSQASAPNELIKLTSINQVSLLLASIETSLNESLESESSVQSISLRYLKSMLIQFSTDLKMLDLQMPESSFELLSQQVEQFFALFTELESYSPSVFLGTDAIEQAETLEGLLMTEQRLIGKWRGYLRLYQEYQDMLRTSLLPNLKSTNMVASASSAKQSVVTKNNAVVFGVNLSNEQINQLLLGFFAANLVVLLWLLISLYKSINRHKNQLLQSVEQLISGEEQANAGYASQEIDQVCQLISKIASPLHTEQQYQTLKSSLTKQLDDVAQLSKTAHWMIDQGKFNHDNHKRLDLVTELVTSDYKSWRQVFAREQLDKILKCARDVQKNNQTQQLKTTTVLGIPLVLNISKKDKQWFGTLSKDTDNAALLKAVEQLETEKTQAIEHANKKIITSGHRLSKMLVQAMLHSQNIALVSGTSVQSSYRPLTRMFEWVRQQQLIAQLSLNDQVRNLQDVVLVNEIDCAVYNILSEANLQQNRVILQCDENLASGAQVDVRLFGRLLVAFSRLALKDEFKSTLKLSVSAIDQSAGQQLVKITASVNTAKSINKLPAHIKLLNEGALDSHHTGVESYFFALLERLHGKSLQAGLTDNGYSLSFEIPITTSIQAQTKMAEFPFSPTNILVICSDKTKQQVVKKYLDLPSTKVEGLEKVELFSKQFDIKSLNRRKLDLVVYIDRQNDSLTSISKHIEQLPKSKQPKLLVLQDSYHISLAKQGLYSLASAPLSRVAILQECERLLRTDDMNNLLVSSDSFKTIQYLPSQVDLLLAVKSPQQHQSLWLVLQWLGFNVKVVCHGKSMQKHWQTGRYLVLFNEFEQSPFIELETGKSIARGVFNFFADEVIALDEKEAVIGKNWEFGVIPDITNVNALIKLLSSWLKKSPTSLVQSKAKEKINQANADQSASSSSLVHAKIFDSNLIDQLPPAFDLKQYADNQGSAELAVYMLDEYIMSISENIQILESNLAKKSYQSFDRPLQQINLTANILSAKGLLQICQQLNHALKNEAYDKIQRLLEQVKIELSAIKAYAEAI